MTGSQGRARARELGAVVETYAEPGEPAGVKDLIDVAGQPTRNGTPGLAHRTAATDSTVWARMRAAGYAATVRTSVPELAWSARTPGCGNPWAPDRDAGGSSGGSAVVVATGEVSVALGTDTGGSIRIPAALCGVAGLRPTHGVVPMDGITPCAPSMDTVGPLARTARECLRVHGILTGTTPEIRSVEGLRVGWVPGLWRGKVDPEIEELVERAAARFGAVETIELPAAKRYARGAGYTIMLYESAQHWWSEYLAHPDGLRGRAITMLRQGSEVSTSDYTKALEQAAEVREEVGNAFEQVDILLLPTVPVPAAPLAADTVEIGGRGEDIEAAYFRLTALAAVSGHPALSVPVGRTTAGLPVGAQLVGRRGQEDLVCSAGETIEYEPGTRRTPS